MIGLWLTLSFGLLAVTLWACLTGPFDVSLSAVWSMITLGADHTAIQEAVFLQIRVPRVALGLLVGATLGVTGALTQGVFRNPLAEPALVGIGGGAALAATLTIAFGGAWIAAAEPWVASVALPVAAFLGAVSCAWLVHLTSARGGRTSVTTMLLVGIAINALCFAGIGVVQAVADDAALRGLTFWLLGSVSGATWGGLLVAGPLMLCAIVLAPRLGHALDAFMLGEQ
ncbi:MAG: iron complex transport system permease protein, partial [Bradymonadia bacterium]